MLMRFVLKGKPQAGLPLLNGGAIVGYALSYVLVYGSLSLGITW
jgi:presenilin-like A22 family membrane protease